MPVTFSYKDSASIDQSTREQLSAHLHTEKVRMQQALHQKYATDYASLFLPNDAEMVQQIKVVIAQKKALKPTMLIVIGIGGSNLGTLAVHQALQGKLYNEQQPDIKVYFADTVDSDYIADIMILMEQELQRDGTVILNVISKSGSTTETIANFEVLLFLLKQYRKNTYHECVVVTTDHDSQFSTIAAQEHFTCLPIPVRVGGRFSVFSAVGLFPLGLLGIDIDQLLSGAQRAIKVCVENSTDDNPAALSALALYHHYQQGCTIHDTFLFSVELEGIGRWYRQLLGESIGKKSDVGITPTVSIGSTDLHSVGQLYLGGPRDKFTTFITVEHTQSNLHVPMYTEYETLVPNIQGISLATIMHAIILGTQRAYQIKKLPFVTWQLSRIDAATIGYLLQCTMIEILYLGFLFNINPFDQPHVESYKQETRKILSHE
jgi:glucose-6-phosphate isomerase